MVSRILFVSMLALVMGACNNEPKVIEEDDELTILIKKHSPTKSADWYIMPESTDFADIPNQDPTNKVTAAKVELGKMLFFETGIGINSLNPDLRETYSCSTCHIPEKSFTPGRFQGIADGGMGFGHLGEGRLKNPSYEGSEVDAQGARPLPTINLAYVRNTLWNGSFGANGMNTSFKDIFGVADPLTDINSKGIEGLEANNHRALIVHRQEIKKELLDYLGYTPMFDAAFPNIPTSERYTLQIAANAIAAYFRTIYTNQAPFQRWLKGDASALSEAQKRGATLFYGKAGCINCHNSPSFNGQRFAAIGVKDLDQNGYEVFKAADGRSKGRGGFTLRDEDLYKFKVPQLYNLKDISHYFHGSSKTNIKAVVQYFNHALPENERVEKGRIDPLFIPLGLTDQEVDDLTEFLTNGLYDPNLIRYKPSQVMSGNCFPNNDLTSQLDMGCK
ncbi:MAG: c-type cytochrome [Saprospiraceae bacterium]|nr:c-type cytochrome [Saprospiraceae bacterium]